MRYVDSASRQLSDTLHAWLAGVLPRAAYFGCQTGYFRFDAVAPFEDDIKTLLERGGRVDLVVGANEERLSEVDLEQALELLASGSPSQSSFTLVGARDGLFHPKTYYVALTDGAAVAAVGSANLTWPGLTHHIEACVLLDSRTDDPAILDRIRDAIEAWPARASSASLGARPVTNELVRKLAADRAIDPVPIETVSRSSGGARSFFPPLPRITGLPRRRGTRRPASRRVVDSRPEYMFTGAQSPFPLGAIGIVKRLSRTDTKGFGGRPGTPYLALPANKAELASRLPMHPYGVHEEPRLDLRVEARLDAAIAAVVNSGRDATNITHVGVGTTQSGNVDLRFNLQHGIHAGLRYVATQTGARLPEPGDPVAVEFVENGRLARLTFASVDPLRATLLKLLLPGRPWGWLPDGVVPEWEPATDEV